MKRSGTIDTTPLFAPLRQQLIDLLRSLAPRDWHRETVCAGWSVKDVTAHLLDTSLRTISLYRDDYTNPDVPDIHSYRDLVTYLNQLNNDWVQATRRLSGTTLTDWLEQAGATADDLLVALPPDEPARFSVAWAGHAESPNWFHVAREYTERWHHQQQIRMAVDQLEGILSDRLYWPVLDTFMQALPYAYRDVAAPTGTLLHVSVADLPGGGWWLLRQHDSWQLTASSPTKTANATVTLHRSYAWELFTRQLPADVAAVYACIEGDQMLGQRLLAMRTVMI